MARLSVLFSGSSGNCTYIKCGDEAVLIDAGVSAKRITAALAANGVETDCIKGVFVTHEHIDHIDGLRVFTDCGSIPVYANAATIYAMKITKPNCVPKTAPIYELEPGGCVCFERIKVTPFATSHDAAMSVGYKVECADGRTVSYVTDLGVFSDEVFEAVKGSDAVVLEANHDIDMLRHGPYPYPLIERILSEKGHLSNVSCAAAAVRLVNFGTTRIILAHLSRENNTPALALSEVEKALADNGKEINKDYLLFAAAPKDGREYIL